MTITREQKENLTKTGYVLIQSGVLLWTKKALMDDQKTWDDDDKEKKIDFSTADYWITTDSGDKSEAIDSVVVDIVEENEQEMIARAAKRYGISRDEAAPTIRDYINNADREYLENLANDEIDQIVSAAFGNNDTESNS